MKKVRVQFNAINKRRRMLTLPSKRQAETLIRKCYATGFLRVRTQSGWKYLPNEGLHFNCRDKGL